MERFHLTIIILVLSVMLYWFSSETAARLDRSRFFNYANPAYIVMVIIALGSALTGTFCFLDMVRQARKILKSYG